MKRNSVSIQKAAEIIGQMISVSSATNQPMTPVMLHGSSGVAKSSIIKQMADKLGYGVVDLRLSAIDATDLMGIPFINQNTQEMVFSTPFYVNECMARPTILFLDEITNAAVSTQHAAYRLVLDRSVSNGKKLPTNTVIIAAGNLVEDKTGAKPLVPAFSNRFGCHLLIDKSMVATSFLQYAVDTNLHRDVVGFLTYKKTCVLGDYVNEPSFATPRTWEVVSKYLSMGFDEFTLDVVIAGAIGDAMSVDFATYRKLNASLPDWNAIRANGSEYVYDNHISDMSLSYAISTGLVYEMVDAVRSKKTEEFDNLCNFYLTFTDEIRIIVLKMLKSTPDVLAVAVRNKILMDDISRMKRYVK